MNTNLNNYKNSLNLKRPKKLQNRTEKIKIILLQKIPKLKMNFKTMMNIKLTIMIAHFGGYQELCLFCLEFGSFIPSLREI